MRLYTEEEIRFRVILIVIAVVLGCLYPWLFFEGKTTVQILLMLVGGFFIFGYGIYFAFKTHVSIKKNEEAKSVLVKVSREDASWNWPVMEAHVRTIFKKVQQALKSLSVMMASGSIVGGG